MDMAICLTNLCMGVSIILNVIADTKIVIMIVDTKDVIDLPPLRRTID